MHKNADIFENHLNPLMYVFIGYNPRGVLSDEYPYAKVSVIFQDFCIILYLPTLIATSSISVKGLKVVTMTTRGHVRIVNPSPTGGPNLFKKELC